MEKLIRNNLSECLGFDVPQDLVNYIMDIETNKELKEYLKTLLNFDNPKHRNFLNDLTHARNNLAASDKAANKKKKFKKFPLDGNIEEPSSTNEQPQEQGKKKPKFVNLYSQEGQNKDVILLKGRHHCDCQASKHKLVNNCIECGRIVCEQEGSGPCLFCGNLVCSVEEQQILNSTTKKSASLYNKLMEKKRPQGWEAAVAQRNRLLEYDRSSEKRTKVTDDDSDYFNDASVWLSKNEREKLDKYQQSLREKKHASKLQQTFTIDFAGRQLIEEKDYDDVNEDVIQKIMQSTSDKSKNWQSNDNHNDGSVHPEFTGPPPTFDTSIKSLKLTSSNNDNTMKGVMRIQDPFLQEMGDRGACLSMHQPWASLLVAGIKLHEGRSWYSAHRGRLWIASTVQPPSPETVQSMENMYQVLYPNKNITFPKNYPVGCLLGCVNVDECLPQEEYREKYPEGESESPFVFVCSDPREMPLKFPMSGKHKIYIMDNKIHQAAVKSLQKMIRVN